MINGRVNAQREATIGLSVRHPDGTKQVEIDAIVDTGFNGSLTLPPSLIAEIGLPWRTRGIVILANGSEDQVDIHTATVLWDGRPRNILVESADTSPLVGMALLVGYELHVQVIDGGQVAIEKMS